MKKKVLLGGGGGGGGGESWRTTIQRSSMQGFRVLSRVHMYKWNFVVNHSSECRGI